MRGPGEHHKTHVSTPRVLAKGRRAARLLRETAGVTVVFYPFRMVLSNRRSSYATLVDSTELERRTIEAMLSGEVVGRRSRVGTPPRVLGPGTELARGGSSAGGDQAAPSRAGENEFVPSSGGGDVEQ